MGWDEEKLGKIEARRSKERNTAVQEEEWAKSQEKRENEHALLEGGASTSRFIRHADDPSLNQWQRQGARWDDPARHFVDTLEVEKQKYRAPPNRFDILPGRHWDGVDRSNGFEKKLFQKRAEKISVTELSHKHDYEDL